MLLPVLCSSGGDETDSRLGSFRLMYRVLFHPHIDLVGASIQDVTEMSQEDEEEEEDGQALVQKEGLEAGG